MLEGLTSTNCHKITKTAIPLDQENLTKDLRVTYSVVYIRLLSKNNGCQTGTR